MISGRNSCRYRDAERDNGKGSATVDRRGVADIPASGGSRAEGTYALNGASEKFYASGPCKIKMWTIRPVVVPRRVLRDAVALVAGKLRFAHHTLQRGGGLALRQAT